MKKFLLHGFVLLAALGLAGCNSSVEVVQDASPPPPAPPDDTPVRLADSTNIHLAEWLKQPRSELADLVVQWTATVQKQRQFAQENPLSVDLLPGLSAPGTMLVFHEAAYSPKAGFSLPPYLRARDTDPAVALHLARLGDREAALKVADPADKDLLSRIDARRAGRNYPLEWTQLTALAFQSAEWKLAVGDPEAAADLIQMHRQLRELLDEKAAAGPLGAALLPLGRRALAEATAAWKQPVRNKALLAGDVEAALKGWGETPPPALALAPGASQLDAVRLFGHPATGQAVSADNADAVSRALDLLELPVPDEGVRAVVAFFDGDKRLIETLVLYRPNVIQSFPEPVNLAHSLVNHGLPGDDTLKGVGLTRRTYEGDGLKYEVAVLSRGSALGGFVRIAGAKSGGTLPPEARDFGAVHLDRTYDQNRVQFARDKTGPVVDLDCRKYPGVVRLPFGDPVPDSAVLERDKSFNLTASLAMRWPADEMPTAAAKLIAPLLAAYGSARIEGVAAPEGDFLAFLWEDSRTRLTLRLPYETNPPVFKAENRSGAEAADTLVRAAESYDQTQRKARLDAGKPLRWLPRSQQLQEIQLGMTKKQVQDNLPRKASIDSFNLKGDLSLVFHDDPAPDATYFPRQMFLHFGPGERLIEIRVRYQEGPAKPDDRRPSLLTVLKKAGGEPRVLPAPWAGLWADLPAQEPKPALYRWTDDVTVLTCQRDGGGDELILRDWPADQTADQTVEASSPLRFCDEGAAGVSLGQSRSDVLKKFPKYKPLHGEDAVAIAAESPYETLAVWFDSGKVSRIVAQHEVKPANAAEATAKMQEAWMRDFDRLCALRRQDGAWGPVQQAYGWHDDKVRVRLLTQQTDDGLRLLTEWRAWPVSAKP